MTPSALPPLHLVTDDAVLARPGFEALARDALAAGGSRVALHLRGPRSPGARLHELSGALLPAARAAGALLLVNDRVDLALALPVDGVHLGARSLPVAVARRLLGDRRLGRSVHAPDEAVRAARDGADYLVVGTVFATPSHPERVPGGTPRVAAVAAAAGLPLVAIGGVTPARVAGALEAGAVGVAVLSGVWDAPEPARAVEGYLQALSAAGADGPTPPAGREP